MEVLHELYFGKVTELQQLEDTFEKLKIKYQKPSASDAQTFYKEIIKDPLLQKIGDYIKELFGFHDVVITLRKEQKPNACTCSYLCDLEGNAFKNNIRDRISNEDIKASLIVTRDGMRFDAKKFSPNLLIIFTTGLIFSPVVSSAEIVAVLLHEIGHNFTKSVLKMQDFTERSDEKFADQFVAMYGYGPELNSSLSKIKMKLKFGEEETLRKIPIVNIFVGLRAVLGDMVYRTVLGDEHPGLYKRMSDTIAQLEEDLRQTPNLSTKMKNEIKMQIQQCKIVMEKFYDDKPYMTDRMYKFYTKNIEPRLGSEKSANLKAEKAAGSVVVNNHLKDRMKSSKGYFKSYKKK